LKMTTAIRTISPIHVLEAGFTGVNTFQLIEHVAFIRFRHY
jgi:hypothetical protein